jgi:hypothetical protein
MIHCAKTHCAKTLVNISVRPGEGNISLGKAERPIGAYVNSLAADPRERFKTPLVGVLWEFGVRHVEMPATPQRVWQAIQATRRH